MDDKEYIRAGLIFIAIAVVGALALLTPFAMLVYALLTFLGGV